MSECVLVRLFGGVAQKCPSDMACCGVRTRRNQIERFQCLSSFSWVFRISILVANTQYGIRLTLDRAGQTWIVASSPLVHLRASAAAARHSGSLRSSRVGDAFSLDQCTVCAVLPYSEHFARWFLLPPRVSRIRPYTAPFAPASARLAMLHVVLVAAV